MATKLNDPVRTPSGELTTISRLDSEGRIQFTKSDIWIGRNGKMRTCYMAELVHPESGFWEIGKVAYLSRTTGRTDQAFN